VLHQQPLSHLEVEICLWGEGTRAWLGEPLDDIHDRVHGGQHVGLGAPERGQAQARQP
jgi:hypothetical protein